MSRDAWRKAHDRSITRAANREFAIEGYSTYPHVWGDDPDPFASERPISEGCPRGGSAKAVWFVFDSSGIVVKIFDYRDETAARTFAAEKKRMTGHEHYVERRKV